jgi:hypothetical protein
MVPFLPVMNYPDFLVRGLEWSPRLLILFTWEDSDADRVKISAARADCMLSIERSLTLVVVVEITRYAHLFLPKDMNIRSDKICVGGVVEI